MFLGSIFLSIRFVTRDLLSSVSIVAYGRVVACDHLMSSPVQIDGAADTSTLAMYCAWISGVCPRSALLDCGVYLSD